MTQNETTPTTPGLIITGTDTDVGKTYLTALIARQLKEQGLTVGVYKPACSGAVTSASSDAVNSATGTETEGDSSWADIDELNAAIQPHDFPIERICPQKFLAPLAPPVAAKLENKTVDETLLNEGVAWWHGKVDILLIEGVGGLLCPLTETKSVADWAADIGFPLLIVGRLGLGTINHTLMTVEIAEKRGLKLAGLVLNQSTADQTGYDSQTNPAEIASRCKPPLLGVCHHGEKNSLLQGGAPVKIDWASLASISDRE